MDSLIEEIKSADKWSKREKINKKKKKKQSKTIDNSMKM